MKNKVSVTIVIPCYNAATTLAETINGVQAQSIRDWRLLVVDDGSTDESANIVESYAKQDPRIELQRQSRGGVSAARNKGAGLANSDWIAFLDADDVWHPEFLSRVLEFVDAGDGYDIGFARVAFIGPDGQQTGERAKSRLTGLSAVDFLNGNPTITTSNIVVKRTAFERIGGFQPGMAHAEDQMFLLRAALLGCRIEGLDQELIYYRTNAAGLSSDLPAMRRGWEAMANHAALEFPNELAPLVGAARARNLLYLARRALRLRRPPGEAFEFLSAAIAGHPAALWRWPWPTVPLLAASLIDKLRSRAAAPHLIKGSR